VKDELNKLAILGGRPAFDEVLHVGAPNLGSRDQLLRRIGDILDRRWLTNNGVYVREFERRICDLLGSRHCVVTSNGTVALELTIRALDLRGEVIVPSFTFIATAHALQWQRIRPVFCDIDRQTHQIDVAQVERLITPLTTGIVGVHTWGNPCAVDALTDISERHGLRLIFDAAHAFGCSFNGRMIGNFGDAECFSFHATKFCTSLEGGAIVTNDDLLADKLRLMRNFGFDGPDNVVHIGTNGKLNEVSAAMGITSMESMNKFIEVNYRNYKQYEASLDGVAGIVLHRPRESDKHNYQYIVTLIDRDVAGISRDDLLRVLHAEHILARRYFYPGCHRMEPYRSTQPRVGSTLENTDYVASRVLVLPTGTSVDRDKVRAICQVLRLTTDNGHEVTGRLALS